MLKNKWIGPTLTSAALAGMVLSGCGTSPTTSPNKGTSGGQTADKNVTIGYVNWAEDVAVTSLWKELLEKKGYSVTMESMDAGPLFVGLAHGGIDIFMDTWLPYTHKTYIDRYGSQLQSLGQWYQGEAKIGLVVPKYTSIDSITQLNQHASDFQNNIVGIDPGAGEMTIAKKAVTDYGLKLNLVSGSEATMLSALTRAEAQKKPIVVTLWSPHWAFSKWDLKYLTDPKGDFGKSEHIQTEANMNWAKTHSQPISWLKNFKLNPKQLGSLELDLNSSSDKTAGVKKWIKDNQNTVNSWFTS